VSLTNNYLYRSGVDLGYSNRYNRGLLMQGNYIVGGLTLKYWKDATIKNNFLFNPAGKVDPQAALVVARLGPDGNWSDLQVDGNTYVQAREDGLEFAAYDRANAASTDQSFTGWKSLGYDANSTYVRTSSGKPTGAKVVVRQNKYDPNRRHLIIYNWDGERAVLIDPVDLGASAGDELEIHNVQDYFGDIRTLTSTGQPVVIPMTGWNAAAPVGLSKPLQPITFPEFGAFVVITRRPETSAAPLRTGPAATRGSRPARQL
jgi:hypothetical protein